MGVKAIACWLNAHGCRTRAGGLFGNGAVHKILTNPVYVGKWTFNKRSSKALRQKPVSKQIVVDVPAIIAPNEFEAIGELLKSRDPRAIAPRVVTGPILLTGLAVCGACGDAMTLRTGTSKSGAVHRYYTCSNCARQGKLACQGRSIPMAKLDALVTGHLIERLLHPQRLTEILASINVRRAERALELDKRVANLQTEVADADDKLRRLYRMVEEGVTEIDDVLKGRLGQLKTDRERAKAALDRIVANSNRSAAIEPEAVETFSRFMRENVASGAIPFRKAYIQSVVDRIEVDDGVIRIVGDKATPEQAVAGRAMASGGVRRRVPKWRARRDFELPTPRFVVWCSIQLSYGRVAARRIFPGATEAAVYPVLAAETRANPAARRPIAPSQRLAQRGGRFTGPPAPAEAAAPVPLAWARRRG